LTHHTSCPPSDRRGGPALLRTSRPRSPSSCCDAGNRTPVTSAHVAAASVVAAGSARPHCEPGL